MKENPGIDEQIRKKEDLIPEMNLLSLAEERASSAPITEYGVFCFYT